MAKKKVVKKIRKKAKKDTKSLGKKEFIFNLISLVVVLGIALYFGGRSLYYYSLQNAKTEAKTLSGLVLANNKIVNEGDGFHQTEDGYIFKGNVENNYVWFANRLFRILSINEDESVRLISENYAAAFMWGENSDYKESNLRYWLTKTKAANGVYFSSIPSPSSYLVKTSYSEDKLDGDKVIEGKKKYKDFVTTLTITDYTNAGGKNSFLKNGKLFYLIGHNSDDENIYVEEDGSVVGTDTLSGYGIRPVITLNSKVTISQGDGSHDNPFMVDMGGNNNYIDSYVKLDNDTYKVFENQNNKLKMYKITYITNSNGEEIADGFNNSDGSRFDLNDRHSIAYYLNGEYYSSLSYKDYIVDNYYYNGYINEETEYKFLNNYTESVTCKVALLNIFDYNSTNELNDYYHINTISDESTMAYSTYSNGLLFEEDVKEWKHIVPVISINKDAIKGGTGRIDDPYTVG